MAELKELKGQFLKDALAHGIENPPQQKLKQWIEELRKPLEPLGSGRLANHFTLSCTVELGISTGTNLSNPATVLPTIHSVAGFVRQVDAYKLCIEAASKRSCVELVAAIWRTLALIRRRSVDFGQITSGATVVSGFQLNSLNSAIGFSRKGANRFQEVLALDALYGVLLRAGVFDLVAAQRRMQGDYQGRKYGLPGDIRSFHWGYDYRSFPSFVESPFQMLLVLTLAKLAVMAAPEVSNWSLVEGKPEAKILNLLARFKGLDDDARLVYWWVAKHGLKVRGGDFEKNWKLEKVGKASSPKTPFPKLLQPSPGWIAFAVETVLGNEAEMPVESPWWSQHAATGMDATKLAPAYLQAVVWGLRSELKLVFNSAKKGVRLETWGIPNLPQRQIQKYLGGKVLCHNSGNQGIAVSLDWLQKDAHAEEKFRRVLVEHLKFYSADSPRKHAAAKKAAPEKKNVIYQSKWVQ